MKKSLLFISILLTFLPKIVFSQAYSNNWTWIKGTNTVNESPVYGTIGVEAATNSPGSRSNAATWTDNGNLYMFGGYSHTGLYLSDLWVFKIATNNWTWLKGPNTGNQIGTYGTINVENTTNLPGGRTGAGFWEYNGKFYLMGGYGYANFASLGYLSDVWEYNPATNNWTWIKGSNAISVAGGTYGSKGVESPANTPAGRFSFSVKIIGNKSYLFGGYGFASTSSIGYLNDLWIFNHSTKNWTWQHGSNLIDQLGNYGTKGVSAPSNVPGSRFRNSFWTTNNKLYIYSGRGKDDMGEANLADLWEYDITTNNYTWLHGEKNYTALTPNWGTINIPNPNNIPGIRNQPGTFVFNNKLFLFGGLNNYNGVNYNNDVWEYNPNSNNWIWIKGDNSANQPGNYGVQNLTNATNNPGARYSTSNWFYNNTYYMAVGEGPSTPTIQIFNDMWKFEPSTCADEITSVANGNWNSASTWSCNRIPNNTDAVVINGHTVTLSADGFAKNITYLNGGTINLSNSGNLQIKYP